MIPVIITCCNHPAINDNRRVVVFLRFSYPIGRRDFSPPVQTHIHTPTQPACAIASRPLITQSVHLHLHRVTTQHTLSSPTLYYATTQSNKTRNPRRRPRRTHHHRPPAHTTDPSRQPRCHFTTCRIASISPNDDRRVHT